jgi:PIN domain nuclease of toxin-antitoxin system
LIASSFLPADSLRDPADKIMVATAREQGLTLMTRDRMILDYAAKGHVSALAC